MDERRYLRIYLSERIAVAHAGRRLAGRMRGAASDPGTARLLDEAGAALAADAEVLASFLRQLGASRPRLRMLAASAGERLGRLKLNGRVTGRSPLADLEELEGLVALVRAVAGAWSAIEVAGVASEAVVDGRAEAMEALADRLAGLRPVRAERALAGRR